MPSGVALIARNAGNRPLNSTLESGKADYPSFPSATKETRSPVSPLYRTDLAGPLRALGYAVLRLQGFVLSRRSVARHRRARRRVL